MSRTKHGAQKGGSGKGPGYEYWGRRPYSCKSFGPWVKKMTHRAERRQNKKLASSGSD